MLLDLGFIKWLSSFFQVQFRAAPNTIKITGGLSSLTIYDLGGCVEANAGIGRKIPNVCNPVMGGSIGQVAFDTMGLDSSS